MTKEVDSGLMISIDCTHQNLLVQLALHWSTVSRLLQLLPAGRPSLYSCTPCFTSYAIFFHIVEHLSWVYLFGVVVSEETRMAQHWMMDWRDEKMGGLENQWNLEFVSFIHFLHLCVIVTAALYYKLKDIQHIVYGIIIGIHERSNTSLLYITSLQIVW